MAVYGKQSFVHVLISFCFGVMTCLLDWIFVFHVGKKDYAFAHHLRLLYHHLHCHYYYSIHFWMSLIHLFESPLSLTDGLRMTSFVFSFAFDKDEKIQ